MYQPTGPTKPVKPESILGKWMRRCFVFVFELSFGWILTILRNRALRKYDSAVRENLAFLFDECGGEIVDEGKPRRKAISVSTIVLVGNVQLHFETSRGEFYVSVASKFKPDFLMSFKRLAEGLLPWGDHPEVYELKTFAPILHDKLPGLQTALSEEHLNATLTQYIEAGNAAMETYSRRLRESGIEPVEWETPVS